MFDIGTLTIRREALLSRIAAANPKILALVAPAGFGKTSLVRQVLEGRANVGICDCTRIADEIDFARRIVPALADEHPERAGTLAQTESLLAEGAMSSNERLALALAAWRARSSSGTFVFENAEHLTMPAARDLLAMLLAECPQPRSIVICSRAALPIHLSRFAAPHRILTLRAADLAIEEDELRKALHSSGVSEDAIDRVHSVSQGWAIAVFLLARFANEGRLDDLLNRLNDVAFEDLQDYLAEQVLGALDDDVADALFAAACIPNATRADIEYSAARGWNFVRFHDFALTSPFVSISADETYIVHPLLGSTLLHLRSASRERVLCETAEELEAEGKYLRAAELQLERPNLEEAARVLEQVSVAEHHAPSMRYAHVLASLGRSLVKRHPTLWATSAVLQMFSTSSQQLFAENSEIWQSLGPETALQKRYYIFITRVLLLIYLGRFREAEALVDAVAPRESLAINPATALDGYALYLHGNLNARAGRLALAQRDLEAALPLVKGMDILGSGALMILGADVARALGDRSSERELLEQAVLVSLPSELENIIAQRDAEVTFGAWLAGEDGAYSSHAERLARAADERGIRGFAFFVDRLRGRPWREPDTGSLLKWTACGFLVACADAADRKLAESLAKRSLEAARRNCAPFPIVLAAIALAERTADATVRMRALDEARDAAASIESPALQEAVRRVRDDAPDFGMLDAFVTRRLRVRHGTRQAAAIVVEILSGSARHDDETVALTEREFALIAALARQEESTSRRTLTDMLWPELDEHTARNRLHATLHRLRERFPSDELVALDGAGYRLGGKVAVDIWEIGRLVRSLRARHDVSSGERAEFRIVFDRICRALPRLYESTDWLEAMSRRINELACELGTKLARCALEDDDPVEALEIAEAMIARDSCDEAAQEIAIRARLLLGDRAAALRQFRSYRQSLRAELDCEPSSALAALVTTQ